MLDKITQTVKENAGKSISIAAVVGTLGLYTGLTQVLDQRYALAEDARQIQQSIQVYRITELEDKILMIELLEKEGKASPVDLAMKERYIRRLEDLRHKK